MKKYKFQRTGFENIPCLVCFKTPSDKAHIKTRGAGAGNEYWEMMPLCRICHIEQGTIGIVTFINKYFRVKQYIEKLGWTVEGQKLRRK